MKSRPITAGAIKAMRFVKGLRVRQPGEAGTGSHRAVIDVDLEIPPQDIGYMAGMVNVLNWFDANISTDHPLFKYLGDQYARGEAGRLTVTMTIEKRET